MVTTFMNKASQPGTMPPHAAPFEALGIVLICFGWFILGSLQALQALRGAGTGHGASAAGGFTDTGFVTLLVWELVLGAAALMVLHARRYPLHALAPQPSWMGALVGVGLYVCVVLLVTFVQPLVPPAASAIAEMVAGAHVSGPVVVLVSIVNGTYEEVFLLGYLMRGMRRHGASTAIGIAVLVRLLYHMYQGPAGAVSVVLCGLVFSVYYHYRGRLFPVVLAHIIADMAAFI
jgi:membrane protease YdiL (CAAX protease family)